MHEAHEVLLLADEQLEGLVIHFVEDTGETIPLVGFMKGEKGLVEPGGQPVCKLVELDLDRQRSLDGGVAGLVDGFGVEEFIFIWVA